MLLFFVCVAENRTFSFWIFLNQTFRFRFEKTVFSFCGFNEQTAYGSPAHFYGQ